MRFEIRADGELIGHSDLEFGDPPMGVAFGRFNPAENYVSIRPLVLEAQGDVLSPEPTPTQVAAQEILISRLQVWTSDGTVLEPCSHVYITDLRDELEDEALEVAIAGLDHELYERYFPQHVQEYKARFAPPTA